SVELHTAAPRLSDAGLWLCAHPHAGFRGRGQRRRCHGRWATSRRVPPRQASGGIAQVARLPRVTAHRDPPDFADPLVAPRICRCPRVPRIPERSRARVSRADDRPGLRSRRRAVLGGNAPRSCHPDRHCAADRRTTRRATRADLRALERSRGGVPMSSALPTARRLRGRPARPNGWQTLLLLSPWLVTFAIFGIFPPVYALAISFFDYSLLNPQWDFVGM